MARQGFISKMIWYRHGMCNEPIYHIWENMKARCYKPSYPRFADYGGRGIAVYEPWKDFINFFNDMGKTYFRGASIERLEVNQDYSPSNCIWLPKNQQNDNKRSSTVVSGIPLKKKYLEFTDPEVKYVTFANRVLSGWDFETAAYTKRAFRSKRLSKPVKTRILVRTPLKIIGGKSKIRERLYPLFPDHSSYYEPFLGSATILLGKEVSGSEVANDLNPEVINFFNAIKTDPEGFWTRFVMWYEVFLSMESKQKRSGFDFLKKSLRSTEYDDQDKNVFFYLINKHCFNGIFRFNGAGECNSSFCGTTVGRGILNREWYDQVIRRIKDVKFTCADYRDYLYSSYDFAFIDPPYSRCLTTYNGNSWSDLDFIELESRLSKVDYKWLMTINDNEFILDLFNNYEIIKHDVSYSCSQTNAGRGDRPELLVANYPIRDTYDGLQSLLDEKATPAKRVKETVDCLDKAPGKRRNVRSNKVSTG